MRGAAHQIIDLRRTDELHRLVYERIPARRSAREEPHKY